MFSQNKNEIRMGDVLIRQDAGVVWATLDRPRVINALNDGLVEGLEQAVAKKYGRRFANWSYAGDGKVDCTWKRDGRDLKCRATAVPCAD